jgi:GT2 family glycosyltransferase
MTREAAAKTDDVDGSATVSTRPSFRIVVPTYRRPHLLKRFLDCLVPQLATHPEFRLVIVNDGTHDAAYEDVIQRFTPPSIYLKLPESRGPGPARQAGFAGAYENYLVNTDDDCEPPPFWLDELLALAMTYPDVDVFAGRTIPVGAPRGIITREIAHIPNATPAPVADEFGLVTAPTANALFRRELFEKSAGFAADMIGAAEDCFVTQRILKAGGTWMIAPHIVTGHRAIQSVGELRRKFRGYGLGAAQYVIREQDWRVAAMHTDGRWRSSLRASWISTVAQWDKPENRSVGRLRRLVRCVLTLLARLAYERGWRRGLKQFSSQYGRARPSTTKLAERYNDFCREIVLPRRPV